jgi:WD40 repeat protein
VKASWSCFDGSVTIEKDATSNTISAHMCNIQFVTISNSGNLLATVSKTGTLIRIWNTNTMKLVNTLRRGFTKTEIQFLVFSKNDRWLCVAGLTIHIFDLLSTPYMFIPHISSYKLKLNNIVKWVCFNEYLTLILDNGNFLEYDINFNPLKLTPRKFIKNVNTIYNTKIPHKGEKIT